MKTLITSLLAAAATLTATASPIADALRFGTEAPPLAATLLPLPDDPGIADFSSNFAQAIAVQGDFAFVSAPASFDEDGGTTRTDDDETPGVVYVYRNIAGTWSITQELQPSDARSEFGFGVSLDISEDGHTLVVGTDDRRQTGKGNPVQGGAYVYSLDPVTGIYSFAQKLVPPTAAPLERTALRVGISGDWIALGAPAKDDDLGSAYIFHRATQNGSWAFHQELRPAGAPTDGEFGRAVSIDGDALCIAAPMGNDDGRVFIYHLQDGFWVAGAEFATPFADGNSFGWDVALSGDRLVATFRSATGGEGNTYTYSRSGGTWTAGQTLVAGDPDSGDPDHQTVSIGSGRGIEAAADIVITGGTATAGTSLTLGEIFLLGEDSTYTSRLVLGDLVGELPVPAGMVSPWSDRFGAGEIATDGNTVIFDFYPNRQGGGFGAFLAAIGPGPMPDPVAAIESLLFYDKDAPIDERDNAAFAYQRRLYTPEIDPEDSTEFHLDVGSGSLYGPDNRANADKAESLIRLAYPGAAPALKDQLSHLYLDLAYGRATAELILARELLDGIESDRIAGNSPDFFFIDTEIALVRQSLDSSAAAMNIYLDLFADDLGLPPVDGLTTGRRIFAEFAASRPLDPARNIEGDLVGGSADPVLPSHRDLVLFYEILLQHARTTSQLGYLLTAKGDAGAEEEVRAMVGDITRLTFEQRVLAESLFPGLTGQQRSTLGLDDLTESTDVALSELAAFTQNLDGTINLFGYEPEFLLLINSSTSPEFFTFDILKDRLAPAVDGTPLFDALDFQQGAIGTLDNYRSRIDRLKAEWDRVADISNGAIVPRLVALVGAAPPTQFPADPNSAYANPQDNPGSDIQLQYAAIEQARLRIELNRTKIANLRAEMVIEYQRRAVERGINADLSNLIIDYGNRQASMTQEIGRIEATQEAAKALAEGMEIEKINPVQAYFTVVNAGVQATGELDKANLQASKERLAASQEAAVRDADDAILDNNSKAFVKTRLLEMNTLNIDTQEAVLILRQEIGRLVALVGEKRDLERRLVEARNRLSSRYDADPVHRIRAVKEAMIADIQFREARQRLFFMVRALEYKWNQPFFYAPLNYIAPGGGWNAASLFQMRNAAELKRFYDAMVDFDQGQNDNRPIEEFADRFSLREDFFGFYEQAFGSDVPQTYDVINPDTGQLDTGLDAITAFRYELRRRLDPSTGKIAINFDTVRRNGFEVSGEGIENYRGKLFDPQKYLDLIDTVQVFIPGPHTLLSASDQNNTVAFDLSYAGTTFIRQPTLGPAPGSDLRAEELISYPTQLYLQKTVDATGPGGAPTQVTKLVGEDSLGITNVSAVKLLAGRELDITLADSLQAFRVGTFRERPVAATAWTLELTQLDTDSSNSRLQIDEIDDVVLWIRHQYLQRTN